jgi:ribosome-binding protein aMBF1 (putative translation factor)
MTDYEVCEGCGTPTPVADTVELVVQGWHLTVCPSCEPDTDRVPGISRADGVVINGP